MAATDYSTWANKCGKTFRIQYAWMLNLLSQLRSSYSFFKRSRSVPMQAIRGGLINFCSILWHCSAMGVVWLSVVIIEKRECRLILCPSVISYFTLHIHLHVVFLKSVMCSCIVRWAESGMTSPFMRKLLMYSLSFLRRSRWEWPVKINLSSDFLFSLFTAWWKCSSAWNWQGYWPLWGECVCAHVRVCVCICVCW